MSTHSKKSPKLHSRAQVLTMPRAQAPQAMADLAQRIASSIIPKAKVDPSKQVVFAFRTDPALRDAIHSAADAAGLSATAYVIQVLKIATTPTK